MNDCGNCEALYLTLQFCTSAFLAGGSCHAAGLAEPGTLALSPLSTLANYLPGGILEAVSGSKPLPDPDFQANDFIHH